MPGQKICEHHAFQNMENMAKAKMSFGRWNHSQNGEILWDFLQFQKSTLPFGKYRLCFKVQRYVLVEQVGSIFLPITVKLLDKNMLPLAPSL